MTERILASKSIKQHEGFRGQIYDDATGKTITQNTLVQGKPTIGYGRNVLDNPLSENEADYLLGWDLQLIAKQLTTSIPRYLELNVARRAVLIEMCYNLGFAGLMGFKKMLKAIEQKKYSKAADEMLDSKWADDVGKLPGQRAHTLSEIMRQGK